jgi:hypothetical protein
MLRFAPRCRLVTIAIAVVAGATTAPAAAQAADTVGCPDVPMSHPFAPWGDSASYLLAPDGGLERGGSVWVLTGGAAVGKGNESAQVGGPADRASLALPAGSSATTARMCIGIEHKWMRFFVKRAGKSLKTSLDVDVLYSNLAGKPRSQRIGRIVAGETWAPSPVLPLVVNQLAVVRGNAMEVSFRFTPQGGGFSIDDVYVDPWRSR